MDPAAARAALRFHLDAGADEAIAQIPSDRFTAPPAPERFAAPDPATPVPMRTAPAAPAADQATIAAARARAESAETLEALRAALEGFEGISYRRTAGRLVFADGNPASGLMLIGEAPGAEEDRQGLPFVGRAGQLLDRMLAAIGRDRTSAYITNLLNWRPPGNRTPDPEEAQRSLPFLHRHIALARPKVIVTLGAVPMRWLLGVEDGILRTRGRWFEIEAAGAPVPALATLHPAYLLRAPAQKKLAWADFLSLAAKLEELSP